MRRFVPVHIAALVLLAARLYVLHSREYAPADLPKDAASFDLPIALGVLAGSGQFASERFPHYAVVGELALDGTTRPTKGALSMAMAAAEQQGLRGLIVPSPSAAEAAVVENIEVIAVASLSQAVAFLAGQIDLEPTPSQIDRLFHELATYDEDFADVRGQELAKRALTIVASGGHNVLMLGPPGSGKTMLAKRLPTILPDLTAAESIETTRIYSALGRLKPGKPLLATRPFRSPHHTISNAGLVGGGSPPAPGEISLAHNGVLLLDELPEFNRQTLEVLRQPLEDGTVTISRALASSTFPAEPIGQQCGELGRVGEYLAPRGRRVAARMDLRYAEAHPTKSMSRRPGSVSRLRGNVLPWICATVLRVRSCGLRPFTVC